MKFNYLVRSFIDCEKIANMNLGEIVLSPRSLSRIGQLNSDDIIKCIDLLIDKKVDFSIDWDILMTQNDFDESKKVALDLIEKGVKNFRVKDIGALKFLLEESESQISFYLGYSNQNTAAIEFWKAYLGDRLGKIIIAHESSKDFIKNIRENYSELNLEVTVLSKILLSYTPRKLIGKYVHGEEGMIHADSLEGPNKKFPIIQNQHGTMLFYKDYFSLIDQVNELDEMQIDYGAFDIRLSGDDFKTYQLEEIKNTFSGASTTGFYDENETEKVFGNLKNKYLDVPKEKLLGDIVDVKKDHYLGLMLNGRNRIDNKSKVLIKTPDGKSKQLKICFLKDGSFAELSECSGEELVYINYFSGVTYKSLVFMND